MATDPPGASSVPLDLEPIKARVRMRDEQPDHACIDDVRALLAEVERVRASSHTLPLLALAGMWTAAHDGGLLAEQALREHGAVLAAAYERGKADARGFCADSLQAALRSAGADEHKGSR